MPIKDFVLGRRTSRSSAPPIFLQFRSSKTFILTTICLAVFTDIFLYGIIVPVTPYSISSRAGVPEDSVQSWTSILLAVYGAALFVTSPIAGWYADRSSSRRLPLLLGLLALAGSTVMLCLARNVGLLVAGRLLQGLSASIVWTVGQALLVDTVGQKEVGETLGYVSLSMSLGILVAPLLGGVVYERAGYYPVFYMAFGLLAVDVVLRLVLVEKKIAIQWAPELGLDVEDADYTVAEEGIVDGRTTTGREITSGCTAPAFSAPDPSTSPTSLTQGKPVKSKKWYRNLPPVLTLLSSRRLLAALWGCLVQASLLTSFDSVIPLFVQRVFHWDATGAGLMFITVVAPAFTAPLVGMIADRSGPRWLVVFGFVFAVPFWVLLRLVTSDSIGQKVLFCALLALIGVSLTCVMGPLMAEITYVVEAKEKVNPGIFGRNGAYAQAYGLFVMAYAGGTLVGPLWSGYVEDAAGWGTMSWTLGLFSLAGAVPCLIWTGGLITDTNAKSANERAVGGAETEKKEGEAV